MDCINNTRDCPKYMVREICRETCPYAEELRSYGVGAMIIPPRELRGSSLVIKVGEEDNE